MGKSKKKIESYIIDRQNILGKGSFGQVCLCEHQVTKQINVAKIISKQKVDNDPYMKNALNQQILIQFRSQECSQVCLIINRFLEVFETNNNIYIIQQYCENGTLRNILSQYGKMTQSQALHCLKCICLGFTQIVKKGIMHRYILHSIRDLKPQNILVKQNQIKIADFGFAKKLINHRQMTTTALGTPFYMAPQLLKSDKYSSKCDIWSVGIIYYQLLYGTQPWKGGSVHQLLTNISNNDLYFNPQIFLIQTLQYDQDQRLSWLQVFQHKIWTHLYQNQFKEISIKWRLSYVRAAQKLNVLAQKVQIQQLIAAFLQIEKSTLNYDQFQKVILWLFNQQHEEDIGIMYQLFDKDCNGVIDFQQFTESFGFADGYKQIINVLKRLLDNQYFYHDLKYEHKFYQISQQLGINEYQARNTFNLISKIEL